MPITSAPAAGGIESRVRPSTPLVRREVTGGPAATPAGAKERLSMPYSTRSLDANLKIPIIVVSFR
ncbi:MAG: hypothetical protein ACLP50_29585 [Solirubrobacteraceae bacterium]